MYKIKKGIPIPEKVKAVRESPGIKLSREKKYPFADMAIGDCFFAGEHTSYMSTALSNASRSFRRSNNKDHWVFQVAKTEKGLIGIWRTK